MGSTAVIFMLGGLTSLYDEHRVSSLTGSSLGSIFLLSLAKIGRHENMLRLSEFIQLYIMMEKKQFGRKSKGDGRDIAKRGIGRENACLNMFGMWILFLPKKKKVIIKWWFFY